MLRKKTILAAEGKFFRPLPRNSTRYEITDEGLDVALGIALIEALQKAEEDGEDLAEQIKQMLDPISALDKTSQMVFAALIMADVDKEKCSPELISALMKEYLCLRNIEHTQYAAFSSVVRSSTEGAMRTLLKLIFDTIPKRPKPEHTEPEHTIPKHTKPARKNWLNHALQEHRRRPECWAIMTPYIKDWLRCYSKDPALSMLPPGDEECALKSKEELDHKLQAMTDEESSFLKQNMIEIQSLRPKPPADSLTADPSEVAEEALHLLAGMPLAPFSEALVACSYSLSLNSCFTSRIYKNFYWILRLNKADWSETRQALLHHAAFLNRPDASVIAKKALGNLLRGASFQEDAVKAEAIHQELIKDFPEPKGWRRVEQYCPVDPCDPTSERPPEIDKTAEDYSNVNLALCFASLGESEKDLFIRKALPGVARFAGDVAVTFHRNLAEHVAHRTDQSGLIPAVYSSMPSLTALLTETGARRYLSLAENPPFSETGTNKKEREALRMYSMLTAFPHLSGDEQIDFLSRTTAPILRELHETFAPSSPQALEKAFETANQTDSEETKIAVAAFAFHSGTELTRRVKSIVTEFLSSPDSRVKAYAFAIAADSKDPALLKHIAHSPWRADTLEQHKQRYEVTYGSAALIEAGAAEIITTEEVIERISPERYGHAVARLGDKAASLISDLLDNALKRSIDIQQPTIIPKVNKNIDTSNSAQPPLLSLDISDETLSLADSLTRLMETSEDFSKRQNSAKTQFDYFLQTLTINGARLIVEHITIETVDAVIRVRHEQAIQWANLLLEHPKEKLRGASNFGWMLACGLSHSHPSLSSRLFEKLAGILPFINLTIDGIPLEAFCIWKSADCDEINIIRKRRLDFCCNDHEMALQVLTALNAGKADLLYQYADELLNRAEPASKASGLMIYGFGNECPKAEEVFQQYKDAQGLAGEALEAARYAYERNAWARHWHEEMRKAESPEDFWRYSVLLIKIADARFSLRSKNESSASEIYKKFIHSIPTECGKRVKKWEEKRKKTLFGIRISDAAFVSACLRTEATERLRYSIFP